MQRITIHICRSNRRIDFGGEIEAILPVPGLGVILGDGLWFEAIGTEGPLWKSERISWDGMRGLSIGGERLTGESWDPLTSQWIPFDLELSDGRSRGGSFASWRPA